MPSMQIADEMGLIGTEIFDWSYTTASNVVLVGFHLSHSEPCFPKSPNHSMLYFKFFICRNGAQEIPCTTINHVNIKYHLTIKVNWAFYSCILTIVVGWS